MIPKSKKDKELEHAFNKENIVNNHLTREICQRCGEINRIGFYSPLWKEVAGRHWENSILCINCFSKLGDEKYIEWDKEIKFYPVSFKIHMRNKFKEQ